jgi:autotransporter-associated beta strand protein
MILAAACLSITASSRAAQFTWTGGGGTLNTGWNVDANWSGGNKPVSANSSVIVFGPGAGDNFQDISIPLAIHEIQFAPGSSDNVGGFPLDLHGDPTIQQQTGFIHTDSTLTNTINNNLVLSDYLYVTGSAGSGPIVLKGSISGTGELAAANRGVLRLAGNNTFSGGIDLSYGDELQVTNSNSLGTGSLFMDAGTKIRAYGAPVTLPNAVTFYNVGTYSFTGDKDITFNGPATITNGGPKEFDVASGITARFNGVIGGNQALQVPLFKTGGGTMTLAGNNTFAGSFTVSEGTLAIGAQDALPQNIDLTVNSGATMNLGTFGNGNSSAPSKPIHSLTLNGGTLRVPNSSADFWLNQLNFTGGSIDMTGSILFWMHFNGATPKLKTNPSNQTATIGGGIGEIRNNSADDLVFDVGAGTTASGIDLDVDSTLVSVGGKFHKTGGGTMRLTATGNSGKLLVDGGTFRFDDPNVLTFSNLDVLGGGTIQYGGTGSIATSQQLHVHVGSIDVPNAQATANFTSGNTGNGVVYKRGAGTLALPNARQSFLKVYEGNVRINPNGTAAGTSKVESLWLYPNTRLDLTDNALVTSGLNSYYTYSELIGVIKSGYNGGAWNGVGIMSSSAAANPGHALGVAKATDVFQNFPATFMGQTVDADAVLVRYTRYGDANLDGMINLNDFNRLASSFGTNGKTWSQGDFNYDGTVNLSDFNLLASNFGLAASSPDGPTPQDWSALAAAVPEPALLGVSIVPGLASMRRRRRS